jgi:hypothetical protein
MSFEKEKREALEILESIENGTMSAAESFRLIEGADPTLVYFIFEWLKQSYSGHPAAEGVLGRLIALCSAYPAATKLAKEGQADLVVRWFEEAYQYRELGSREFIELIVEKLEG